MAPKKTVQTTVKIGEAARLAGLSVDAIRFYQREGLLRQPARTEGGFRLLGSEDIRDLRFIRKAQELGFSLADVRELLVLQSSQTGACSHVQDLLERRLRTVVGKISELRNLERRLRESLRRCRRELRAEARADHKDCPFLREIKGNGWERS